MYAKFINENEIEEAPSVKDGAFFNYNDESNEAMLFADGYKPVTEDEWLLNIRKPIAKYRDLGESIEAYYIEGYIEPTYAELRAQAYPEVIEQLDKLYHDIDSGMFGESAKTSEFYLARKAVKDEFPKPESDSPSTEEV